MQLIGMILGMSFAITCSAAAGLALASYFINKNNKCGCVKRWERIKK